MESELAVADSFFSDDFVVLLKFMPEINTKHKIKDEEGEGKEGEWRGWATSNGRG